MDLYLLGHGNVFRKFLKRLKFDSIHTKRMGVSFKNFLITFEKIFIKICSYIISKRYEKNFSISLKNCYKYVCKVKKSTKEFIQRMYLPREFESLLKIDTYTENQLSRDTVEYKIGNFRELFKKMSLFQAGRGFREFTVFQKILATFWKYYLSEHVQATAIWICYSAHQKLDD